MTPLLRDVILIVLVGLVAMMFMALVELLGLWETGALVEIGLARDGRVGR